MSAQLVEKISRLLTEVGVISGDSVFVHSDMASLLRLLTREEKRELLLSGNKEKLSGCFHAALRDCVGERGTISALAGYTDYARFGKPFIVEESLPDLSLGAYPRHLFGLPERCRSLNPITSVIAVGEQAAQICRQDNAVGYGFPSVWQRLLELNSRMLFVGVDLGFMTFVHHVEHMAGIPHIYNKIFTTPIFKGGVELSLPVITGLRYLKFGVVYNLSRMEADMHAAGLVAGSAQGLVKSIEMRPAFDFLMKRLPSDPYYLLHEPPKFERGMPPLDGNAGPEQHSLARKVSPITHSA